MLKRCNSHSTLPCLFCYPARSFFEQQPLDKVEPGREGERRMLYWLVEDGVKKR